MLRKISQLAAEQLFDQYSAGNTATATNYGLADPLEGSPEFWRNRLPKALDAVNDLSGITKYVRSYEGPNGWTPERAVEATVETLSAIIDLHHEDPNDEYVTTADEWDFQAFELLALDFVKRNIVSSMAEWQVMAGFPLMSAPDRPDDETSGVDLRFVGGITVQVKSSYGQWPKTDRGDLGDATMLIAVRLDRDGSWSMRTDYVA
jgi:hypothetical protein